MAALESNSCLAHEEHRQLIPNQRSLDEPPSAETARNRILLMNRLYSSFDAEACTLRPPGQLRDPPLASQSNYVWHRSATLSSIRNPNRGVCRNKRDPRNMKHANSGNLIHQSSAEERNPLVDVSNEYMRVQGYKPQFKTLLLKPASSKTRLDDQRRAASAAPSLPAKQNGPHVSLPPEEPSQQTEANKGDADRRRSMYARRNRSSHELQNEMMELRQRLSQRKKLFFKRTKLSDVCVMFAAVGMILTVIESELTGFRAINKSGTCSNALKGLIVASTFVLLVLIFYYHQTEVQLLVIDSGTDDWRVAITWSRIIKFFVEEAICVVCPFPGTGQFAWPRIGKVSLDLKPVYVDVLLAIPMFLRCYLICRFMVLHSRLFQDAATRSIAALNHVSVDFKFVLKTMMMEEPLRVLLAFTVVWWIILSWLLAQCERAVALPTADPNKIDPDTNGALVFLNSLWFIVITFMSIGYGDVVPNTFCGRALGITTGIVGIGVASALIAVISRKLELTRAEKHVNAFMADTKLAREHKNAAARVLQEMWFIHKHRNSPFRDDMRVRIHQRKFLSAINAFRQIKWEQRRLGEQSNMLIDMGKSPHTIEIETEVREAIFEMQKSQNDILAEVQLLSNRLCDLYAALLPHVVPSTSMLPSGSSPNAQPNAFTRHSTIDRSDDGQSSVCSSMAINFSAAPRCIRSTPSPNPTTNPLMRAATIDRSGPVEEPGSFKLVVPQSALSLSNIDLDEERV